MKLANLLSKLSLLLIITIYSCSTDENNKLGEDIVQTKNVVSFEEAQSIATSIKFSQTHVDLTQRGKQSKSKEIESEKKISSKNGVTDLLYVINYKGGGFVIISADKRTYPIRAFSETGKFSIKKEDQPSGLTDWLNNNVKEITQIKSSGTTQSKLIAKAWQNANIQKIIDQNLAGNSSRGPRPTDCYLEVFQVASLLSTQWHQGNGFNFPVGGLNCQNGANPPTGCVAPAMGQIMKYHEYPNNYNWNGMPDNEGSQETVRLMKDIGVAVGMTYTCEFSGANFSNIVSGFNSFGYSNTKRISYNAILLKRNLDWNRPVILSGYSAKKRNPNGTYLFTGGHAWVCDGYKSYIYHSDDCYYTYELLYLHMNWGWEVKELNGWYCASDWSISWNNINKSYNEGKYMFVDIYPNTN